MWRYPTIGLMRSQVVTEIEEVATLRMARTRHRTLELLKPYLFEETYEVIETIEPSEN